MSHVINPAAYENAISQRIRMNATITRGRKLRAEVANDSPEFRIWLGLESLSSTNAQWEEIRVNEIATSQEWNEVVQARNKAGMRGTPFTEEENDVWQKWQNARRVVERFTNDNYKAEQEAEKAFHKLYGHCPSFLTEAIREWGGLTDGQLAFARKAFAASTTRGAERTAQDAARIANAPKWTTGRHRALTGEILSIRQEDGEWGMSTKGMVKLTDGRLIWMSLTGFGQGDQGTRITIGAITVERISDTDATMAFGLRPHKVAPV